VDSERAGPAVGTFLGNEAGPRRIGGVAVVVAVAVVVLIVGLWVRGEAAGAPAPKSAPMSAAALSSAPGAQIVPGAQPGIAVVGNGEASAPAESATMQVIVRAVDMGAPPPTSEGAPSGPALPPTVGEEQVQPVIDAIVATGVPVASIEVVISPTFGGFFGPGTAQIVIAYGADELGLMAGAAEAALAAAQAAGLGVDTVTAAYEVADCEPLLADARRAAAEAGREQAEGLAEILGLTIGDVILASESPAYGGAPGSGCVPETFADAGKGNYLPPFDPNAPAEVEIYSVLNLAYAIV
jgi:hypothetical protein